MTRPDDLDLAEERVAAARAKLNQSTNALQAQMQPRVIADALLDRAAEQRRTLAIGAAGVVGVLGAAALVSRMLRRRRAAREADPAAYAKKVGPSSAKPQSPPRVRYRGKRKNP